MKKLICFLLVVLLLCGCRQQTEDLQSPVHFYYCNSVLTYDSPTAVISPEVRESAGYNDSLMTVLNLYFSGPASNELVTPFPSGTAANNVIWDDTVLHIELNAPFAELKGLDLTIACACLSKTVIELTNCSTVRIFVAGTTLDGKETITMDAESALLMDEIG